MKRVMLVFVLGILLVSFISAADVAYVLRNPKRADQNFLDVFEEMNLEVELIVDKDIKEVDFSKYGVIFIGDTRLRNSKYIPVANVPSIIANQYYGKMFGLVEKGGISKIAANQPLRIKKNGDIIQAYLTAMFKRRRINIPYYYVPAKYKKEISETVATTFVGYKKELGDVVAHYPEMNGEARRCFFGITKAEFWTPGSKELFMDCVNFVVAGSVIEKVHDVEIVSDYTNSVNGVRIRDIDSGEYLIEDVSPLLCGRSYKVDFKTMNNGDFTEDVLISGSVNGFEWDSTKTGLLPGKSTTTGSKTIEIDDEFPVGHYTIEISAMIDGDANPGDNVRVRAVEVVCEE